MRKLIQQNISFLIPYLVFLLISLVFLIIFSKNEIHIYLNQFHCIGCDYFFKYYTFLGNGWFVLIVAIALLFYQYRLSFIIAISTIITGVFVQLLKRLVFDDMLRPVKHFEGIYDLYLIPGINNFSYYSFPSGHTASAFSFFLCLALATRNNSMKFIFFFTALLVGYSRIYLSQHFLIDVYFGSLISVLLTIPIFYFIKKKTGDTWENSLISKRIK
ncbi:phosphatase PAP2 family protein [candidate division KSB1 bacterium]